MPELRIYGVIGQWWDDISAKMVIEALGKCTGDLLVRVHSPGGEVWEGFAIYNAIKRYDKGRKTVVVDGIAASAASYIAMAGDEIVMPENTMMMIHDPLSLAFGTAEEMRKEAEVLDKIKDSIVTSYRRCGKSDDEIRQMMADETWMTAEEAKALGFCDRVGQPNDLALPAQDRRYDHVNRIFDRLNPPPKYRNFYAAITTPAPIKEPTTMALNELLRKAIKDITGIDPVDDATMPQISAALYTLKKNADDGVTAAATVARLQGEIAKHEGEKRADLIAKGLSNGKLNAIMVDDIKDASGAVIERSWANSVSLEALAKVVTPSPDDKTPQPGPRLNPQPPQNTGNAPSQPPQNTPLRTAANAENVARIAQTFNKTPEQVLTEHATARAQR